MRAASRLLVPTLSSCVLALSLAGCGGHDSATSGGLGPGSNPGVNGGVGLPALGGSPDAGVASTDGGSSLPPDAGGGGFGTLEVQVVGFGSVGSSPAGVSCGGSTTCRATFATGTLVTLQPSAASGFVFTGWSGLCQGNSACVVDIALGDTGTVVANFASR